MSGFFYSAHHFGRSTLIRQGKFCYILWQTSDARRTITLSRVQYLKIKSMLGSVRSNEQVEDRYIKTYHIQRSKNYNRVKRYLIKEELIHV